MTLAEHLVAYCQEKGWKIGSEETFEKLSKEVEASLSNIEEAWYRASLGKGIGIHFC